MGIVGQVVSVSMGVIAVAVLIAIAATIRDALVALAAVIVMIAKRHPVPGLKSTHGDDDHGNCRQDCAPVDNASLCRSIDHGATVRDGVMGSY